MSLELLNIHEKGKQDAEYVELKATDACDLQFYMVADTTYTSDTSISNKVRHTYWFAPKKIAKGDYVFLRTGKGQNTTHANTAKTTTHVFYWGLDKPVWNNAGDAGVLFTLASWKTKRA